MKRSAALILCLLLAGVSRLTAQTGDAGKLLPGFVRVELRVEETVRTALIHAPAAAKENAAPVVFVFHGHGGSMLNAARSFAMHRHWPEAICVYPQGLPTPGPLTDPEGKRTGWQHAAGEQGDRDFKFFDALLTKLKADYKVDEKRLYCTARAIPMAVSSPICSGPGAVKSLPRSLRPPRCCAVRIR